MPEHENVPSTNALDDARVKIRVAAERFPWFTFVALRRLKKSQGGGWAREQF